MVTRIILADDHRILREGICSLVATLPEVEIVGEADDGRKTVDLARKLVPDIVVMDIGMPNLNGIEATKAIKAEIPTVKVIALSMHSDARYVAEMLKAGASGYMLKDSAFEELAEALRVVMTGRVYLSPGMNDAVMNDYVRRLSEGSPRAALDLSPREKEVLQLLAEGLSTKEIADRLHVSAKTADTHRQRVMNKLGLRSVAELTKYAVREGLSSL